MSIPSHVKLPRHRRLRGMADFKLLRTDCDALWKTLQDVLAYIRSSRKVSIGGMHNTYSTQIGVDTVERWTTLLESLRDRNATK